MKKILLYIGISLLLLGCQPSEGTHPVWINEPAELQVMAFAPLFQVQEGDWSAMIFTSGRPVQLKSTLKDHHLALAWPQGVPAIAGPATLRLNQDRRFYYFPCWLASSLGTAREVEMRSPKTVNTDSVLAHQQLKYKKDEAGNLVKLTNKSWFSEQEIVLPDRAGTYRAVAGDPLSAYYVQPGSPVKVELSLEEDHRNQEKWLLIGPLMDRYGNLIADGTLVKIYLEKANRTWTKESYTKDGMAWADLSHGDFTGAKARAKVHDIQSDMLLIY